MAEPRHPENREEGCVIVVPKEQALFWLDRRGRWCNAHGVFRNPRISEHFHRSIRRDAGGYYVGQEHGGGVEKVYFPYEDTALFVREVVFGEDTRLRLNTGAEIPLEPGALFACGEALYATHGGERIRFTERAMVQLSRAMTSSEEGLFLETREGRRRIPERPAAEGADGRAAGDGGAGPEPRQGGDGCTR